MWLNESGARMMSLIYLCGFRLPQHSRRPRHAKRIHVGGLHSLLLELHDGYNRASSKLVDLRATHEALMITAETIRYAVATVHLRATILQ